MPKAETHVQTNEKLDRKRWLILVLTCLVSLCTGSLYTWSVFAGPMEEHLNAVYHAGIMAGGIAVVYTTFNAVNPVAMIPGGWINDKIGPRKLVFFGGILMGGSMVFASMARGLTQMIIGFGIPYGIGLALVYGCNINNCVKLFPERRGFASGMVASFHGASAVLLSPIINMLIQHAGVTEAFRVIGIVFIGVICISSLFMQKVPEGYRPAVMGGMPVKEGSASESACQEEGAGENDGSEKGVSRGNVLNERNYTGGQMLRTGKFRIMWTMLFCGALGGMMCISQASALAQNLIQMSASAAAICVSVLAAFNTFGRISAGFLSDRIGRVMMLVIGFILDLAGIGGLLLISSGVGGGDSAKAVFYICICLVGMGYGVFMSVYPAFTADVFGTKHNSLNFNIIFTATAAAGFIGPLLMYRIYNGADAYTPAFGLAIAIIGVGLAMTWLFRRTEKKDAHKVPGLA